MKRKKAKKWAIMVCFSLLMLTCFAPVSVLALENFPFRNGDTITLTVPFSPGGGFDTYARLLAPPLEKAIEKIGDINVSVIVKNVAGAGGRVAHEQVFREKPDGRTLLLAHGGALPYHEVIYKANLKTGEFTYLGQISRFRNSIVARADLPIYSFQDLLKRSQKEPILMASAGRGDDPHISPLLISALLKEEGIEWKMDFVQFEGTAPARASLPRKETEAMYTVIGSLLPIVDSGDARFIVVFAEERDPRCPKTPTIIEEKIPRAQEMLNAISAAWTLVGPPKIPEATREILRVAAFMAINGKEFRERAAKAKRTVHYLPGDESREIAAAKVEVIQRYKDMIEKAMGLR